jgi:cystathionine gamma-synthase
MGGSVVLNPLSSHYDSLAARFTSSHKNELFAADAQVLLSNAQDYLSRTRKTNRNAAAMAAFFQRHVADPTSPVVNVEYPAHLPSKVNYDALMRRSTPELPEPGYGCLFTVDFESSNMARAFYDRVGSGFYPSPHLGAHVTLVLGYAMLFGKDPVDRAYYRELGVREESVRFSVGLEDMEDLIDTAKDALDVAAKAKKEEGEK